MALARQFAPKPISSTATGTTRLAFPREWKSDRLPSPRCDSSLASVAPLQAIQTVAIQECRYRGPVRRNARVLANCGSRVPTGTSSVKGIQRSPKISTPKRGFARVKVAEISGPSAGASLDGTPPSGKRFLSFCSRRKACGWPSAKVVRIFFGEEWPNTHTPLHRSSRRDACAQG